jgi:hypothetical protein
MKSSKRVLLNVVAIIGLLAALRGLLRLLGTASIADGHLRSVLRFENGATMLVGAAVAYFVRRATSRGSTSN